ncbi:hypothetical protein KAR91_68025 [Candidatus Pacearchaeota archaeon]|nr:hypothetical protein [Candidatus Pacearchaeota archaeon]
MPNFMVIVISIGSLLAAWVAAIMAFRSNNIAKKSLRIVEEQAKGRSPLLVPYLMKSLFITTRDESNRIYAFLVSLTNRSDLDNSVVNIQLQLNYRRPGQPEASIVLPHNLELRTYLNEENQNILLEPLKTPAHDTVSGLILFECNTGILDDIIVDTYDIIFTDSNGLQCKLQPIFMTEIVSEAK